MTCWAKDRAGHVLLCLNSALQRHDLGLATCISGSHELHFLFRYVGTTPLGRIYIFLGYVGPSGVEGGPVCVCVCVCVREHTRAHMCASHSVVSDSL